MATETGERRCDCRAIASVPIKIEEERLAFDDPLHKRLENTPGHAHLCRSRVVWQIFHEQDSEDRVDTDYEFLLTSVRWETHCEHQPDYPFTQSLRSKHRDQEQSWYTKIVFDPLPEAFPGGCGCEIHEVKGTALVRRIGDTDDPGTEIDPHVIFHGDEDEDGDRLSS